MNSETPTARLAKIIRKNETVRVSNVNKHNGEFTKSPLETLSYLRNILSPGIQLYLVLLQKGWNQLKGSIGGQVNAKR